MAPYDEPLRSELLCGKFTVLNARDSGGAAIAVFTARDHFPAATSHRTVIQGIAFQLDECLKSYETQKNGLVLLYDMTGSGYHNFDYNLARKVMGLLKVTRSFNFSPASLSTGTRTFLPNLSTCK